MDAPYTLKTEGNSAVLICSNVCLIAKVPSFALRHLMCIWTALFIHNQIILFLSLLFMLFCAVLLETICFLGKRGWHRPILGYSGIVSFLFLPLFHLLALPIFFHNYCLKSKKPVRQPPVFCFIGTQRWESPSSAERMTGLAFPSPACRRKLQIVRKETTI